MSFKKLLGIISIVIIVMFSVMLTTSYAWYAFDNASTTFSAVTNNDDITISYQHGEYISTSTAVPISSDQVDKYADKNIFNINVKNSSDENEIATTISLVDISIDGVLQVASFKVDLYYQGKSVASYAGNTIGISGATTKTLATVTLDNYVTNNFELRVYILDDGTDQSSMMNKTFQAKLQINAISRLKGSFNDYNDPDIYISSITIDGEASDSLPTSGYYSMMSNCSKGSNLTWDPLTKTITYNGGSYVQDSCSLTFTSATNYPLLSEMPVGSYVKYTGNNGCDGKACEGYNANYVSDTDMGYCFSSFYKFHVNGWRIGYIENGSAYLVSAGAPECVNTAMHSKSANTSLLTMSSNYYYGSEFEFNEETGYFSLNGVTSSALSWSSNYESIIENTPYTCRSTSSTGTCNQLYEMVSYDSSTGKGNSYLHYGFEITSGVPIHLAKMAGIALKYCNLNYAKGGICDATTSWAMNADDFKKITGNTLSNSSCYSSSGSNRFACGYTNDLIDNGGYYWYATSYSAYSYNTFSWTPMTRSVLSDNSRNLLGVRPVLALESSIIVIGGEGTYKDPYVISNGDG